jgi:hypothetical protein
MSQMKADRPQTLIAAGALANRFRLVKLSAEYTVTTCGAGEAAIGIQLDTAAVAGDAVAVASLNNNVSCKLEAGAAVAAGALLKSDASGRGITATSGSIVVARTLEAATAAGDLIEVMAPNSVATAP